MNIEHNINIKIIKTEEDLKDCIIIRRTVFGEEQNVPDEIDIDSKDTIEEDVYHFLISVNNINVGTSRYINYDEQTAKLQRMAILKEYRGNGLASKLLSYMENHARENGYSHIFMEAQCSAKGFYLKNGYETESEEYDIIGIPHIKMRKQII